MSAWPIQQPYLLHVWYLQAALDALVIRHDALRTCFTLSEHGVRAHVVPPDACHLHASYIELTKEQAAQTPADPRLAPPWLTGAVQQDTGRPFDLGKAPLLRCTVIQVLLAKQHTHCRSDQS